MMSNVEVLLKRCFWHVLAFTKAKKHRLFLRPERRWNSMTTMIVFCGCHGTSAAENFPDAELGMDQYLLIPFLGGWTSIYQLFWCSPGVQGFDTLPIHATGTFFHCFFWHFRWFHASFMITSASWLHIMRLFDHNLYHLYSFMTYCTFLQHRRAVDCVIAAEASRPRSGFVVSTCGSYVCFLIWCGF